MQGIIGTGKGNEVISTFQSAEDPKMKVVYFGFFPFTTYREDDNTARKLLVSMFGSAGVRKKVIAEAFDTNRCLVSRYSGQMKKEGVSAVISSKQGRPSKVDVEIDEYVGKMYKKLRRKTKKNFREKIKNKVNEKFGVKLSRELIRQITKPIREKEVLLEDTNTEKLPMRVPQKRLPEIVADNGNGKGLIKMLQRGFYSRYAGGLLLNVFVAQITKRIFDRYADSGVIYDLRTFMIMVIQMVQFDIVNVERVKRIRRKEFGVLLGMKTSPSLPTMRMKLGEAVEKVDTGKIIIELAKNYLELLSYGTDIFYVDDHFDVYWGKQKVLQGFSHVYDRVMEGLQHAFVHDRWGNPICFKLRDNYNNFKEYLPIMVKTIKRLYKGKRNPTFVFDRAGYDKNIFCEFVDKLKSYYIVWIRNDNANYEKEPLEYDKVEYSFKRNEPDKARKVKMWISEGGILQDKKGRKRIRKIVIRREAGRRVKEKKKYMYSSLVTNDLKKPKTEIVDHIIYRWREECDFKIEMNDYGIDEITSYMMEEYKKDIFVGNSPVPPALRGEKQMDNPMLKPLRWRKSKINKQITKIDARIGKIAFNEKKKSKVTVKELIKTRRNKDFIVKRKQLLKQLKEIEMKMSKLPQKINRLEYVIRGKFKTFNFSKKLIMDTLKVCARNVRKMALEIFDEYYKNYRDQLDFLKRIINSGGYIKTKKGKTVIEIIPFDSGNDNDVLKRFLDKINSMNPVLIGDNKLPIKFQILNKNVTF